MKDLCGIEMLFTELFRDICYIPSVTITTLDDDKLRKLSHQFRLLGAKLFGKNVEDDTILPVSFATVEDIKEISPNRMCASIYTTPKCLFQLMAAGGSTSGALSRFGVFMSDCPKLVSPDPDTNRSVPLLEWLVTLLMRSVPLLVWLVTLLSWIKK